MAFSAIAGVFRTDTICGPDHRNIFSLTNCVQRSHQPNVGTGVIYATQLLDTFSESQRRAQCSFVA